MNARLLTLCAAWWFAITGSALSQAFVGGLVPDWNQPNWHGVNGPNGGPATNLWDAWCVPTSVANVLGHQEDALGIAGSADGSVYSGSTLSWPGGPSYQDYQANGAGNRGTLSAAGQADGLGWYLDTNRLGDPAHGNGAPHTGTRLDDISPGPLGLNKFFADLGEPAYGAYTHGRSYADAQTTQLADEIAGFEELKKMVDKGRTAVAHFTHWNLNLGQITPGLPPAAAPEEEFDHGFDYIPFGSYTPNGPDFGEIWDLEDRIGHSVTVVGYITSNATCNAFPGTNWVIVHDNWDITPRNVAVPMGSEWFANTIVQQKPKLLAPEIVTVGGCQQAQVTLTNTVPGCGYEIEGSTNLLPPQVWSLVATRFPTGDWFQVLDAVPVSTTLDFPPNLGSFAGISPTFHRAQTFTAGVAGQLDRVDVYIQRNSTLPGAQDLVFELRDTVGGVPTTTGIPPIGTLVLPASSIPSSSGWVCIDTRSLGVSVNPGDVLAIVLYPQGSPGSYTWVGSSNYAQGAKYFRNLSQSQNWVLDTADFGFRVFINTPGQPGGSAVQFYRANVLP